MRGKNSVLFVGCMFCLCVLSPFTKAEEQKEQNFIVFDVVVKSSMVAEYEAAVKEELALYPKFKWPYACHVYSTDDYHYYYIYPVEDFADIGNFWQAWYRMMEKWGMEKLGKYMESLGKTFEYYKYGMIRYRPDLSLVPEKSRLESKEANFRYWGLCYIQPGMEFEFEDVFKQIKALYKRKNLKNIDYGWKLYTGDMGTDMPFYFFVHSGMSAADMWTEAEKRHEAMGQELFDLWWKAMKKTRKFESKTGWFRPDLSYIPKEK